MNSSETEKLNTTISQHERYYDIDWLRIFAIITIFFFHCARFFDYEGWHVKNSQLSFGMTVFVAFVVQWIMPLFFILSGESTYFYLSLRKSGQYIRERFYRLIIPFIFGIFVLIPPQVYLERLSNLQFTGSFIQFYPHYFDGLYGFGGNFAWMGLHLWYLLFLFIFSLITLPFFLYMKKVTIHEKTPKIAAFFRKPGAIFLLAIPLALTDLLFLPDGLLGRWSSFVYFGGWNLLTYMILFVYGYLLASVQFKEVIRKHGKIALAMGVIFSIPVLSPLTPWNFSFFDYPFGYVFISILSSFSSWFWITSILSLGSIHFSFNHRWLKGANEAVLPFYILHQTVILVIGFYIVSLDLSVIAKYLLISAASMATIILLILIIRRMNPLRFLFGMKLIRAQ